GRPMILLHATDGDMVFSAPNGRIHFHSKYFSRETGLSAGGSNTATKKAAAKAASSKAVRPSTHASAPSSSPAAAAAVPYMNAASDSEAKRSQAEFQDLTSNITITG